MHELDQIRVLLMMCKWIPMIVGWVFIIQDAFKMAKEEGAVKAQLTLVLTCFAVYLVTKAIIYYFPSVMVNP